MAAIASAVTFDLFARDRASSAFTKVGKASEDAGKKVRGLNGAFGAVTAGSRGLRTSFGLIGKGAALAAGAAGLGGLIEGFKGVFEEGREAQRTGAQTAAVIKSTGGVAKISAVQVGNLATAISNKVGVDDEAIQSGENLLLTFKGVRNEAGKGNDIFNQASRTITDMAAAMNQGKVTTDGLKTSSIQVGKALNDPIKGITALTKVGVTFTKQQKDQITALVKSGDTLGAQKIILKELNSEFAGSAEAGTTASQKLGVVFGNIKESIGTKLLPVIDAVSTWAAKTLPAALATVGRVAGPIFAKIGDGFSGLAAAFSGEGITSDGFVGVMERIGDSARTALKWLQDTFLPGAVQVFKDLKTKVQENLPKIDLAGLATTFKEQATKWGGAIIDGVKTGLSTGDWSGLGVTIGKGLVAAVTGIGSIVLKIADKIGELLGKVDWFNLGLEVGKKAVPLLVGMAVGILNFDLFGLLKDLAGHWQLVLFAVISVAFAPARLIGKVAEVLGRIPLAGTLLKWAFEHFAAFSKGLVKAVGDALGFMGRAFLDGFRRIFPGIGEGFLAHLRNLPTYVAVVTLEVVAKAKLMMARLAGAISGGIGGVVARIGELIGRMLKPFANAGSFLIRRGVEFVSGLVRGVESMLGRAATAAVRVGQALRARFLDTEHWLSRAGSQLIQGLLQGAINALSGVGNWIKNVGGRIIGAVKGFFGIHSPSTVFAGLGGHLISGLIKGMLQANPTALVGKVFGGMTGALKTLFTKNLLGGITSLPGKALSALGGLISSGGGLLSRLFGGGGGGGNSANIALGQNMAAAFGWTGGQWNALRQLWQGESGWNNNAQNPTSTAYGIAQFLNGTWGTVGAAKTSNPAGQIAAGMQYIRQVYGTPANALSKWLSRSPHWYGAGMPPTVFSKPTLIGVGERGPETVSVTPNRMLKSGGGQGSRSYNINVSVPVGANPRETGRQIVEAIRAYEKGSGAVLAR